MTNEPIHYVPVVEQRYAEIIQDLQQHPARNQWSGADRSRLSGHITSLATDPGGSGSTMIPMAVDRLIDVAGWLLDASGFSPPDLIDLLKSYVQPEVRTLIRSTRKEPRDDTTYCRVFSCQRVRCDEQPFGSSCPWPRSGSRHQPCLPGRRSSRGRLFRRTRFNAR